MEEFCKASHITFFTEQRRWLCGFVLTFESYDQFKLRGWSRAFRYSSCFHHSDGCEFHHGYTIFNNSLIKILNNLLTNTRVEMFSLTRLWSLLVKHNTCFLCESNQTSDHRVVVLPWICDQGPLCEERGHWLLWPQPVTSLGKIAIMCCKLRIGMKEVWMHSVFYPS